MKRLIMVLCLGAVGAISRYGAVLFCSSYFGALPVGTFAVNLLGAFLAGFVFVIFRTRLSRWSRYEAVCLVGFLGGFTTFSAYSLVVHQLFAGDQFLTGICYIGATNILGLLAAYLGIVSAKRLFPARHHAGKRRNTAADSVKSQG
ncbi:MAG: CrcB family protein [Victivallaceae bacterium]